VALRILEARGTAVRRTLVLGSSTLRSGPKLTVLSVAEAASPQLPARVVDLLRP
jgi:hypothetical protein